MFIARKFVYFVFAMTFLLCGFATAAPANTAQPVSAKNNPYNLPAELFPLWNSMSLEEKVGQMIMVYMAPPKFTVENHFGGVLVMNPHLSNMNLFRRNLKEISSRAKVPLLVTIDQEGGSVNRISKINRKWDKTPSAKDMRGMETDEVFKIADDIGKTLHDAGINLNLAPTLDPAKNFHGRETFMEHWNRSWGDTSNVEKVRAFVNAMKGVGIISASKHFPGYDSETNSDLQEAKSDAPESKIREYTEFFRLLAHDVPIVMMSSVIYESVSEAPAVFEPKFVKMAHDIDDDIVVLTDDLWGTNLRTWISGPEKVKLDPYPASEFKKVTMAALDAGNDMFMTTFPAKAVDLKNNLVLLAQKDKKYLERIEKSVARILKMKFRAGLIKN